MTRMQRIGGLVICVGVAVAAVVPPMLRGAAPAAPKGRSAAAIEKDLIAADGDLKAIMPTPILIGDADFRKENAAKIIPVLKKMAGLFAEMEVIDPEEAKAYHTNQLRLMMYSAAFGDSESMKKLDETGASKDAYAVPAAANAKLARWILASKDAEAQAKIVDEMTTVAKDNSRSRDVASTLNFMANVGGANNDLNKKVIEVIRANMLTDTVPQMLSQLDGQQAQLAMVGKPLAFEGRTSSDGTFKLENYKGKVVLLDFWATWCGPCIDELPTVKKAYKDYHDKGFEIVGISCDDGDAVLNDFTKENGMTWVQLREKSQSKNDNWHPLAKKYGVLGIPTMFLIDKQGVVRHVDARDDLAKKIAKLVDEPAKP